jgi:glycine dehydrogenase subunit 1
MNPYIPNTAEQQQAMLHTVGLAGPDDLFAVIPPEVRLQQPLDLPPALAEMEVAAYLRGLAGRNAQNEDYACFLGAGAYDHYIPAVVGDLLRRQEFATSYTPYQPELSQGTLQAIFEFQSMICLLTGMDVANASMYDGATALAEAALMACRATGRSTVLVARSIHPAWRSVLQTYARFCGFSIQDYAYDPAGGGYAATDLTSRVNAECAAVLLQTPNFFGVLEDLDQADVLAHTQGALLVVAANPVALGLIRAPGDAHADIVVGEGQPLGIPLGFGGPYLGFFAARESLLRKMPGRIVGETADRDGKRGYVLTIQAREQHIRREKATSNICSNEGLCALAATIYLSVMGRQGFRQVAGQCARKARYARDRLLATGQFEPLFQGPFFHEFALRYRGDVRELNQRLLQRRILGGADLGQYEPDLAGGWLVAVTEKRTRGEIDALAEEVLPA